MTLCELPAAEWQAAEAAHQSRIDAATASHRQRRADGRSHPVEDFLFRYYNNSPARLRRWHPGAGVRLAKAAHLPRARWTHYRVVGDAVQLDAAHFLAARAPAVAFVRSLLSATVSRPAQLGCFGLHEWAMVHGIPADDARHARWPLRLGSGGTDAVVERHGIRCSHFDAYRFFTDSARPLNTLRPTRETQAAMEQPGCLHAGMDVRRWTSPLVRRTLDASPTGRWALPNGDHHVVVRRDHRVPGPLDAGPEGDGTPGVEGCPRHGRHACRGHEAPRP